MKKRVTLFLAVLALAALAAGCGEDGGSAAQSVNTGATTVSAETASENTSETESVSEAADAEENSLEKTAEDKMNDLTVILGSMASAPVIKTDTEAAPITENGKKYAKMTDERFKTLGDYEDLIKNTCAGEIREKLLKNGADAVIEKDGELYLDINNARGYYIFPTEEGVTISGETDTSFTAVTNANDVMYGKGKAEFVQEDGKWLISKYEFITE